MMYDKHSSEIKAVISDYFNGIYKSDVMLLENAFHSKALLFGNINDAPYFKSALEYIGDVKIRKSPKELDEDLKMNIIGLDIMGEIAMVKVHVPILGYNYYDYLSLAKINKDWKIVNKIFTHVE